MKNRAQNRRKTRRLPDLTLAEAYVRYQEHINVNGHRFHFQEVEPYEMVENE